MAIWYLNMINEDSEKGMQQFGELLSQYWSDDRVRKAEVYSLDRQSGYGVRFYENHVWKRDLVLRDNSETYADNAAENYALGILD